MYAIWISKNAFQLIVSFFVSIKMKFLCVSCLCVTCALFCVSFLQAGTFSECLILNCNIVSSYCNSILTLRCSSEDSFHACLILPPTHFCPFLRSTCGWSWFLIYTVSMRSPSSSQPPPRLVLNNRCVISWQKVSMWAIPSTEGFLKSFKCNIEIGCWPSLPNFPLKGLLWSPT